MWSVVGQLCAPWQHQTNLCCSSNSQSLLATFTCQGCVRLLHHRHCCQVGADFLCFTGVPWIWLCLGDNGEGFLRVSVCKYLLTQRCPWTGNHSLEQVMKDKTNLPLLLKTGTEFLLQSCFRLLTEGSFYISARMNSLLLNVSSSVDIF